MSFEEVLHRVGVRFGYGCRWTQACLDMVLEKFSCKFAEERMFFEAHASARSLCFDCRVNRREYSQTYSINFKSTKYR